MTDRTPQLQTEEAARLFVEYHAELGDDETHVCYLGHLGCSTRHEGACLDETLTRFPQVAE